MRRLRVQLDPQAINDLKLLAAYIIRAHGLAKTARSYVMRIRSRCADLGDLPIVGRDYSEAHEGLRTIPFEGVVIAYHCGIDRVRILRIFRHEQQIDIMRIADEA